MNAIATTGEEIEAQVKSRSLPLCLLLLLAVAFCLAVNAAPSWPRFRGANGQGISERDRPPVEFGPGTNLLWKAAMPEGASSPCVWGNWLFLTAFSSNTLETIALDRRDGSLRWRRMGVITTNRPGYAAASAAASTPATDGRVVCVYFWAFGLVAYDFAGRELWRKPLPVTKSSYGSGTSPVIAEGRVLLNCDYDDHPSFLLAVDSRNGDVLWQTPRPDVAASYSTPILWRHSSTVEIVIAGSLRLTGYAWNDGRETWFARGLEAATVVPSPALGDGRVYAMSYSAGDSKPLPFAEWVTPRDKDGDGRMSREEAPEGFVESMGFDQADLDKDGFLTRAEWDKGQARVHGGEYGIFAIRAPGMGDVTETHRVWKRKRGAATVASPLFYRGRIYVVQDGGRVTCFDAATGEPSFEQERLGAEGAYHASPVAADGRIYFCSKTGVVTVVRAGDTLNVLGRNDLGDQIVATPAIAKDTLYVRTAGHVWAFRDQR